MTGSPHSVHRLSRCMRNWYFRCRDIGSFVNSSTMLFLMARKPPADAQE